MSARLRGALLGSVGLFACFAITPVHAENLADAIAAAYQFNPTLKAQQAISRSTQEPQKQAKAAMGPSITGSVSYDYQKDTIYGNLLPAPRNGPEFGATFRAQLDQPLYTFGRLSSNLDQARNIALAGNEALRASEMQLVSAVINSYAAVQRDRKLVSIAEENVGLLETQAQEIATRLEYRDATETDLTQTNTRLALGRGQLQSARGNYESSRETFRSLVGHYPDALDPLPPMPPLPASIIDAYSIGEQNSPAYRNAVFAESASRAALSAARSAQLPTISATGSIQNGPYNLPDFGRQPRHTVYVAGVTASMPLFNSGLLASRVREARERNESDFFKVEEARRKMRQDIAQGWDSLSASRLAAPQYEAAVQAASETVKGAKVQAKAGYLTTLNVLDATRDLLTSRQAQAQNEANLYIIQAELLRAMGMLDASQFAPDAPRYNPAAESGLGIEGLPTGPVVGAVDSVLKFRQVERPADAQVEKDTVDKAMAPVPPPSLPYSNPDE